MHFSLWAVDLRLYNALVEFLFRGTYGRRNHHYRLFRVGADPLTRRIGPDLVEIPDGFVALLLYAVDG